MFQSTPVLRRHLLSGYDGCDAVASVLQEHFGEHLIEFGPRPNSVQSTVGLCTLEKIRLFYGHWQSPLRVHVFDSQYFMQSFPIRGISETVNNEVARTLSPSTGDIFEPGAITFSPTPDFEHILTLFDPETLLKTVSTLAGSPAQRPLKLDRANFGARPEARLSRGLVKLLVEELDAEDSIPSPVVVAELEQAILVAFLCGASHNYSGVLDGRPPGAAPWQIRRVEEYIEANWDQPISIEALAVVANASARSIFHSFKQHRRYSPMNFVKRVRLKPRKRNAERERSRNYGDQRRFRLRLRQSRPLRQRLQARFWRSAFHDVVASQERRSLGVQALVEDRLPGRPAPAMRSPFLCRRDERTALPRC